MNDVDAILWVGVGLMGILVIVGYFTIMELRNIQRTLAKLPAHLNERREIVLPPREEARQGDVVFHIPSSLYGDRS